MAAVTFRSLSRHLRGLLLVGLGAVLVSGCGRAISPEQAEAFAQVQALGARVNYMRGGYKVDFRRTSVEDDQLERLQRIDKLVSIDLQGTKITDAGLVHLYPIKTLDFVDLSQTPVTDEGVAKLREALPDATVRN